MCEIAHNKIKCHHNLMHDIFHCSYSPPVIYYITKESGITHWKEAAIIDSANLNYLLWQKSILEYHTTQSSRTIHAWLSPTTLSLLPVTSYNWELGEIKPREKCTRLHFTEKRNPTRTVEHLHSRTCTGKYTYMFSKHFYVEGHQAVFKCAGSVVWRCRILQGCNVLVTVSTNTTMVHHLLEYALTV